MTKAEQIFEKHIGLNTELGYLPYKKEDIIDAINEALTIPDDVRQSEQFCECKAPLIRTGTCGDNQEYCGICELDIK